MNVVIEKINLPLEICRLINSFYYDKRGYNVIQNDFVNKLKFKNKFIMKILKIELLISLRLNIMFLEMFRKFNLSNLIDKAYIENVINWDDFITLQTYINNKN